MAGEQLFAGLQGLGVIRGKHRHHRDVLGQINDHIERRAMPWRSADGVLTGKFLQSYGFVGI